MTLSTPQIEEMRGLKLPDYIPDTALIVVTDTGGGMIDTSKFIHAGTLRAVIDSLSDPGTASVDEDAKPFEGFTETFKPSQRDLDALRKDAKNAADSGERLMVSVNVAPSWPNTNFVEGGREDPYHCIGETMCRRCLGTNRELAVLGELDHCDAVESGDGS